MAWRVSTRVQKIGVRCAVGIERSHGLWWRHSDRTVSPVQRAAEFQRLHLVPSLWVR